MYQGKKISVAMATYNGERFIREQLESILDQSVPPDEVVVSDDGSSDRTVVIVMELAKAQTLKEKGVSIRILTDNPRHGHCGNFDWASRHTTGDYIFFCDQDDVWEPDKIEAVADCFLRRPDAKAVFHDSTLIDAAGQPIDYPYNEDLADLTDATHMGGDDYKLLRSRYGKLAVSNTIARGMTLCVTKELLTKSLPFPGKYHDHWLGCTAVLFDGMYYLDRKLTRYRLHEDQSCGLKFYRKKTLLKKLRSLSDRNRLHITAGLPLLSFGRAALRLFESLKLSPGDAKEAALGISAYGSELTDIFNNKGRLSGVLSLREFCKHSSRYRGMGRGMIRGDFVAMLLVSRKKRRRLIRQCAESYPYLDDYRVSAPLKKAVFEGKKREN